MAERKQRFERAAWRPWVAIAADSAEPQPVYVAPLTTDVHQDLCDRVDLDADHTGRRAKTIAFDQGGDDRGSLGGVELVQNERHT